MRFIYEKAYDPSDSSPDTFDVLYQCKHMLDGGKGYTDTVVLVVV